MAKVDLEGVVPSREAADEFLPPRTIGPTWERDEDGEFVLPERTLGWHVLSWAYQNLTMFDGSGPFVPTPEQERFVLWFYALDEDNRFAYPTAVLQRCKGWGKDPLAAVLCIVELVGPCTYWKEVVGQDGETYILGRSNPNAWVGLGATSKDQTANTRSFFQSIVPARTRAKYGMEIQKENIYAGAGQRLSTYGTSPRSMEGTRLTFFIANETHHWDSSNDGIDFYRTITGNLAKVPYPKQGRMLAITNAYVPGRGSQAELTREAEQKVWDGLAHSTGTLYDSLEAHPDAPMTAEWAPFILEQVRGDAKWLSWENNKVEILRGDLPVSHKRRMWYNQVVTSEESLFDERDISHCTVDYTDGTHHDLEPGDVITLGFDGGQTDDSTALVAFRPSDRLLVPIAVWERPDGVEDWEVSAEHVDSAVHWAMNRYDVQAFYADVYPWTSYVNSWSAEFRDRLKIRASATSTVGFDMRGNKKAIAANNEAFVADVREGKVKLNGDPFMRRHMLNAEARYDGFGLKFGKRGGRESPHKIDVLIAGTLAYMAAHDLTERGRPERKKYSRRLLQG